METEQYIEKLVAYVVLNNNYSLDVDKILCELANKMDGYKIPSKFIKVNELPKTNSGKLKRKELSWIKQ